MDERPNQFGTWLDRTMQSRGLSQADVAREVGVADAQVSRWRRGQVRPSVRYLQRIADTFEVPRSGLDRLAGYPTAESDELPPQGDDPERQAQREALQARYGAMLEQLPEGLWEAYADACDALARQLHASFVDALEQVQERARRQDERHIGFRKHADDARPDE